MVTTWGCQNTTKRPKPKFKVAFGGSTLSLWNISGREELHLTSRVSPVYIYSNVGWYEPLAKWPLPTLGPAKRSCIVAATLLTQASAFALGFCEMRRKTHFPTETLIRCATRATIVADTQENVLKTSRNTRHAIMLPCFATDSRAQCCHYDVASFCRGLETCEAGCLWHMGLKY